MPADVAKGFDGQSDDESEDRPLPVDVVDGHPDAAEEQISGADEEGADGQRWAPAEEGANRNAYELFRCER